MEVWKNKWVSRSLDGWRDRRNKHKIEKDTKNRRIEAMVGNHHVTTHIGVCRHLTHLY